MNFKFTGQPVNFIQQIQQQQTKKLNKIIFIKAKMKIKKTYDESYTAQI